MDERITELDKKYDLLLEKLYQLRIDSYNLIKELKESKKRFYNVTLPSSKDVIPTKN